MHGQKTLIAFVFILLIKSGTSAAQHKLDEQVSFIYINGTSTLHDWVVNAETLRGSLTAKIKDHHITRIDSARIIVQANSLKSGKNSMDANLYKTLKTDKYPLITYRLKKHIIHNGDITANGELTLAGVTKPIECRVIQTEAGRHIKVSGMIMLKMTDFGLKPPEFLMGAFRTGNEVTIKFYFMFSETI